MGLYIYIHTYICIYKQSVLNCVLPYTEHERCTHNPSKQEVANRRLRPRDDRYRQFVTHDSKINYFTSKKKFVGHNLDYGNK